jgi:hypothetical protein
VSTTYRPAAATRADAAWATMLTAAVNADPTATAADREQAAEAEMAAYESYWHAHGVPAYAQPRTGRAEIRTAEAELSGHEAGS